MQTHMDLVLNFIFRLLLGREFSSAMVICHQKELEGPRTNFWDCCTSKYRFVDGNVLFLHMQYMEDDEDFIPEVCIPRK